MWLMLNDAFLSIVAKDCPRSSLMVRARRKGDIERIFPDAIVHESTKTDYLYRAVVPRDQIERAMVEEVRRITYSNFKDSVADKPLHDAYLRCWHAMASIQNPEPFSAFKWKDARDFGEDSLFSGQIVGQHLGPEVGDGVSWGGETAHIVATGHMPPEHHEIDGFSAGAAKVRASRKNKRTRNRKLRKGQ